MIRKTTDTGGERRVKLLTKQQSLGFNQSLTEAWGSATSLFGHTDFLWKTVNTHTHIAFYSSMEITEHIVLAGIYILTQAGILANNLPAQL